MNLFTTSGIGMSVGVVWCVIGVLLIVIARKIRSQKRLHQIVYGFSLAGFCMAASYLFDKLAVAQVGTTVMLCCVLLVLIDVLSKDSPQ